MKFAQALKVTDAAARIARLMATLAVLCRKASAETGILSVQARTFWLLSVTQTTAPHHVASRLAEVVRLVDYLATIESFLRETSSGGDVLAVASQTRGTLLAIVDEVQAAMEQPRSRQRRPDDTDDGRRATPTDPRS